jgi:transcription elongation GreA/GreB family factor
LKIILSTVSAWSLGESFENTVAQKNEALREAKVAKLDGDLSENAPYQAAKEKFRTLGRIQRRLTREMNKLIDEGHVLVDPRSWVHSAPVDEVELGTVVVLELNGERESFLIAGARDHHIPQEGEIKPLPYTSPLGQVLLRRHEKEQFAATLNGEERRIRVITARRPTEAEIFAIFPALR